VLEMSNNPLTTFIDKADLFLALMKIKWKTAKRDAEVIAQILKDYGIKKGKILDLMCGNGRISINLAKMDYTVIGVDFSPKFIADAKENAKELNIDNVKFVIGDARRIDELLYDEIFDAVLLVWTSLGYYDRETDEDILRQVFKITKQGGLLIISDIILRENEETTKYSESELGYYIAGKYHVFLTRIIDPNYKKLHLTWNFFTENEGKLVFIDALQLSINLYSLSELVELIENAGWKFLELRKIAGIDHIIAGKHF